MPKIVVLVKQVLHTAELRVDRAKKALITEGVPRVISEADKNAIEEAVRIKEKHGGKITAISFGTPEAKEALREALAMGADEAHLLADERFDGSDAHATANALTTAIQKIGFFALSYDLILAGECSEDQYAFQVALRIAENLNLPQLTYATRVTLQDGKVIVERELENFREVCETQPPAMITVTREINEPRLPTLMAIMGASKKPLTVWTADELGLSAEELGHDGSLIEVLRTTVASGERKRIKFDGDPKEVAENLAKALIAEGVIKAS